MRKLKRLGLSQGTQSFLELRTKTISAKALPAERVEEAKRLWDLKNNKAFKEIRETLCIMASGIERCMYCEDSAGTDIEHFWPKNIYPLQAFRWENYLLACSSCNSNYKRTEFPLDASSQPLLINPLEEEPRHHIAFSPTTGKYFELTDKGHESIRVYGLNRNILTMGRYYAWSSTKIHIIYYGHYCDNGNLEKAQLIKEVICSFPHSCVFIELLDIIDSPDAELFGIEPECIRTVLKYPEIRNWLKLE